MDDYDDEYYSFQLREFRDRLCEIEIFLDGKELSEETREELDDAFDDVEITVDRLCRIAKDVFKAANAERDEV